MSSLSEYYIDPRSLSSKFRRAILRTLKYWNYQVTIHTYRKKIINNREFTEISIRAKITRELRRFLRKQGIRLSKKETKAFVSPVVLWDLIREEVEELPIGVSIDGNYVVAIPSKHLCTNDYLIAAYIALITGDSLWLDTIGLAEELSKLGFHEVSGIPLHSFPRGRIEDFARLLSEKLIGKRYASEILDILFGREELGGDEELPLYSKETAVIHEVLKWKTILLSESEEEFDNVNVFIDLVGVPKNVLWATLLASALSDKKIIILSIKGIDEELIKLIAMRENLIVVSEDCKSRIFDLKIIKQDDEYVLDRIGWLGSHKIFMRERFIPFWLVITS